MRSEWLRGWGAGRRADRKLVAPTPAMDPVGAPPPEVGDTGGRDVGPLTHQASCGGFGGEGLGVRRSSLGPRSSRCCGRSPRGGCSSGGGSGGGARDGEGPRRACRTPKAIVILLGGDERIQDQEGS
ncbi:hypothetical protein NDU88_003790 [Pleurodeles waltl]|uniref:Uncharacterized protein n=1 Tax=Pleurodeles waltl TaxID=8319 RepID=A0AAV7RJ76_PLEWA|nr:hypothetical protein NDU88_003790 [Pleurodeles waltl]